MFTKFFDFIIYKLFKVAYSEQYQRSKENVEIKIEIQQHIFLKITKEENFQFLQMILTNRSSPLISKDNNFKQHQQQQEQKNNIQKKQNNIYASITVKQTTNIGFLLIYINNFMGLTIFFVLIFFNYKTISNYFHTFYALFWTIQIVPQLTFQQKNYHNFNKMNPEANRQPDPYNASSRVSDPRYAAGYPGMPQGPIPNLNNYMLSMGQMYYPPFMYPGFPYPNNAYYAAMNHYRESMVSHPNFAHEMNSLRHFYNPQNLRVVSREMHGKGQNQVINLQSDEQEPIQKNAFMPTTNYTKKPTQKQAQIINLDENSLQKNEKIEEPPIVPKKQLPTKTSKIQAAVYKIQASLIADPKQKQKQLLKQIKTKLISKDRNKTSTKAVQKQQKPSKQIKKKVYQKQKVPIKVEKIEKQKQKQLEKQEKQEKHDKHDKQEKHDKQDKTEKRKHDKLQKAEKIDKNDRNDKNDKNDKNQKNRKSGTQQKNKHNEQTHTRQIAKYLQSHGQIRHGKQFQSDIPFIKITGNLDFHKWLQEKRRNILKRQTGVFTY